MVSFAAAVTAAASVATFLCVRIWKRDFCIRISSIEREVYIEAGILLIRHGRRPRVVVVLVRSVAAGNPDKPIELLLMLLQRSAASGMLIMSC